MCIETRAEILRQATELRRRQDARASGPLRGATMILGGFLTIAAIFITLLVAPAFEANSTQIASGAVVALLVALASAVCWFVIHARSMDWHEGPDVGRLRPNDEHAALLSYLAETLLLHHRLNEDTLRRLRFWLGIQAVITLGGTCLLIAAVLALG